MYIYIYLCIYIYIYIYNIYYVVKSHAICNQQVYYLYYALKITKIYVKINTSKIHQVMKSIT